MQLHLVTFVFLVNRGQVRVFGFQSYILKGDGSVQGTSCSGRPHAEKSDRRPDLLVDAEDEVEDDVAEARFSHMPFRMLLSHAISTCKMHDADLLYYYIAELS